MNCQYSVASSKDLLEKVRNERVRIRELAQDSESLRRLSVDTVKLLIDLGLFRMLQPAVYGGLELPVLQALKLIEEVSAADGAAGWCLLKGASSNQMAGYLDPSAARQIWSSNDIVVAGNFNPTKGRADRCEGGFRLTGRWDWGTGSTHSHWLIGGAMVFDSTHATTPMMVSDRMPVMKAFVFKATDAKLFDTWRTYGMRGTGSGDFAVEQLFVPDAFVFDGMAALPKVQSDLYAIPYMVQAPLPHAALAIGIAQGALDDFKTLAGCKTPLMTQAFLKDRESIQLEFGQAAAAVAASRAYVHTATAHAWQSAAEGSFKNQSANELALACTQATHSCVQVVTALNRLAGGSAVFEISPLQRAFRDIHVAASHFLVNTDKYAVAGKLLLA
jgi:indole-3-acetate monooxygenase